MNKYDFTLVLKGPLELSDDVSDALFAAGCDDGSPGTCEGVFTIDFHREATSLENAIQSAVANVRSAGFEVGRIEMEPEPTAQHA